MNKLGLFLLTLLVSVVGYGRGLRYSVCQVTPEYSVELRSKTDSLALELSRNGQRERSQALQVSLQEGFFGSGVVVAHNNAICVLTAQTIIGYADKATITIYLHEKTLNFRNCDVLGTDTATGLTLITLPACDDLDPLPLESESIEEGADIRSAGFMRMRSDVSWQLERGSVSNAWFKWNNHTYIQHTAPLNAGMMGGPLLVKTEKGYHIVGINCQRDSERDAVALAATTTDITHALTIDTLISSTDALALMCESVHREDPIVKWREEQANKRKEVWAARATKRGIVNDISVFKQSVFYHNYFSSISMETGISGEFSLDKYSMGFLGLQISCMFLEEYTGYKTNPVHQCIAPTGGLYLGYQLPLRVGTHHVLVPRLSQGFNFGFIVNKQDGGPLITSDSRFGLEYHYQDNKKFSWIVALEYTAHVVLAQTSKLTAQAIGDKLSSDFYPYFNHGIGIRLAIGFGDAFNVQDVSKKKK